MNSLAAQLAHAQDAWHKAGEAQKELNDLLAEWRNSNAGEIISPAQLKYADFGIHVFMRSMTEVAMLIDRMIKERKAKWDSQPILEAVICCGEETRKIVIAKPNDRIDEPFVTESFYTAIRNKWKSGEPTSTTEDYDILVINRKGKEVARNRTAKVICLLEMLPQHLV